MRSALRLSLVLALLAIIVSGFLRINTVAAAGSCSVNASPASSQGNAESSVTFSLTNSGTQNITYIRVRVPSGNFYLQNHGIDGWNVYANGVEAEIVGGTVAAGGTLNFGFGVIAAGVEAPSADWQIYTNDGTGETLCTGTLGLSIVGLADTVPPELSELITVSEVTDSSVKISWTTNENATSVVYYGVGESYDLTRNQSTLALPQSVTLAALSANTTYYFYVVSRDASGNATESEEGSFVTAATGSSGQTVTVTNIVTNTVINTQTVTKIITDTTPPSIKVDPLSEKVYESAPVVSGSSTDDRGVARVEYRIKDREQSWSNASLTGEVGAKSTKWEFLPPITLDGTYIIEVRGVDVFGNVSVPKSIKFVIDQLPPTVGGGVVSYGALPLYASAGLVEVIAGLEYEVIVFENGGSDSVVLSIANGQWPMVKMGTGGLWRGQVKFSNQEVGDSIQSKVTAKDGAGNETEREWVKFRVLPRGRILQNGEVVKDAQIKVFWLDPTTKRYQEWNGGEYGVNGQWTMGDGRWGYVLPRGEYYLQGEVAGQKIITQKHSLDNTTTITGDWEIGEAKWWERVFQIRRKSNLAVTQWRGDTVKRDLQVGREKWIGKKSVVVIGTSELPWYSESKRRAEEWAAREGAQVILLDEQGEDDPKGEWLKQIGVGLLPQVYLINDKGDTVDYKEGIWER